MTEQQPASSRPPTPSHPHHPTKPPLHFHHKRTILGKLKAVGHHAKQALSGGSGGSSPSSASGSSVAHHPLSRKASTASRMRPELCRKPEEENVEVPPPGMRRALKLRLVTWNMADNLPTGDLTSLLGEVRTGWPPKARTGSMSSSSRPGSRSGDSENAEDDDDEGVLPMFPLSKGHPYHVVVVCGQECPTASGVLAGKVPRKFDGLGWTSVLEDWLCGGAEDDDQLEEEEAAASSDDESRSATQGERSSIRSKATRTTMNTNDDVNSSSGRRKGPYVLMEKERLMGIYIAVFVARSCEGFVKGLSKGRVTAGLIGGRLGNKGACGISLNFADSRLLFISAHLAAHASGLEIRKANIRKIFEELEVDDFTGADPTGKLLTERFDQVFFMGDLNMRLDITRLHADWLMQTNDYQSCLQFDQLRNVLADSTLPLYGFHEGAVTFAPTYKYDIIKPPAKKSSALGRAVSKRNSRDKNAPYDMPPSPLPLSTSLPKDLYFTEANPAIAELKPGGKDDDALSIISSQGSINSAMSDYDRINPDEAAEAIAGDNSSDALRRAQVRFFTMVRANSTSAVTRRGSNGEPGTPRKTLFGSPGSLAPSPSNASPARPGLRSSNSEMVVSHRLSTEKEDGPVPVFDTSAKQRVQSYCDRVLFKSNVGFGREPKTLPSLPPPEAPTTTAADDQDTATKLAEPHVPLVAFKTPSESSDPRRPRAVSDPHTAPEDHDLIHEQRHHHFPHLFRKRQGERRFSDQPSVESLTTDSKTNGASTDSPGAKKPSSIRQSRRPSLAVSVNSTASGEPKPTLWQRISSQTPTITRSTSDSNVVRLETEDPSPATSPISPSATTSPLSDTSTFKPRRKFTWDPEPLERPSLSRDVNSDPNTRHPMRRASVGELPTSDGSRHGHGNVGLSLNRTFTAVSGRAANSSSLGRIKSFFHLIPFFSTSPDLRAGDEATFPSTPTIVRSGPRYGEIAVLEYDSVANLAAMGASSDHRPVWAVVAIGVEEEED